MNKRIFGAKGQKQQYKSFKNFCILRPTILKINPMQDFDTIIIGSGAGGLAAALCLSRAGQKVLILEQHYVPGGWCHSFIRDGHTFSPGVHFVGHTHEGGSGQKLFEGLGIANDLVLFEQNHNGYDHNIVGDQHFKMPAGVEHLKEALQEKYPREKRAIAQYLWMVEQVHKELHDATVIDSWKDIVTMPFRTRHIGRMGWWKLKKVQDFYLKDPYLKTFLALQCGNYGLSPKDAPFVVHTVLANHCMSGTMYPRGGGAAIVKAFTKNIKKLGGEIRISAGVKKIIIEKGEKGHQAVGVELHSGEKLYAKHIISNADPHQTFFKMVGESFLSKKILKKLNNTKYTAAALNLFLIVDMDLRKAGMDSGNIWYAEQPDLDAVFSKFMEKDILKKEKFPAIFITSPTLKDPVSFDGKHHTVEAIAFVNYTAFEKFENLKYGERSEEYEVFKEKIIAKMLRTVEKCVPGITEGTIMAELGTPTTANHYINSTEGNSYGPSMILSQLGPLRFRPKTEINNLYLCGAATLSHGILGAANSGVITAANILNCSQEDLLNNKEGQHLRTYLAEDDTNWPDWLKKKQKIRQLRSERKVKPIII